MKKFWRTVKVIFEIPCLIAFVVGLNKAFYYASNYGMSGTVNKWIIVASIGGGFLIEFIWTWIQRRRHEVE